MFDAVGVIRGATELADDLWTSKEEEMRISVQEQRIDADLAVGQMEVNAKEAEHRSLFVAGWRPYIGWACGHSLAYNFLVYPLMCWCLVLAKAKGWVPSDVEPPPLVDISQLYPLIVGMLGLGTMRTIEGIKGVKSTTLSKKERVEDDKKGWWRW